MDIINLSQRALTAISLGESHFREFKTALQGVPGKKTSREPKSICRDIGEALVAFANADGGELLIGVEDNGEITGIDCLPAPKLELLQKAPETHVHGDTPLPPIRQAKLTLDGRQVFYFSVLKSTTLVHLTSDGRCVQRSDLESVPIAPDQILLDRQEKRSREYDREFVDGADATDLSEDLVRAVADELSSGMTIEKCLQYLDLAEYVGPGLRLRRAALLLFAKDPNRWHPRLQLRIIKVDGTELKTGGQYNAKSDITVSGNLLQLIEDGWQSLRPQLVQTRLGADAKFAATIMYPELACREALVNAIAHRDYSDEGLGIEIYVFDDRMEIRNPGSLLSSLQIDDLLLLQGVHQSRNSMTARVLRELGYMRELGEGMRRMFELMHKNELTAPELTSQANSFRVTLRHATIYNNDQQLWLEQFESCNLNREQKAIVVLGIGGKLVSPQEIWDSLGLVDTERYRELVKSLQDLRILKSEITKAAAQQLARKRKTGVKKIPRFKIVAPRSDSDTHSDDSEGNKVDAPDNEATVYLSNLSYSVEESDLVEFLSSYGEVENVSIPVDYRTKKKRGYAFAEFSTSDEADQIRQKINDVMLKGRPIVAKKAHSRFKGHTR